MNELKYKGYTASIEFSAQDKLLVGRLEHVEALVMFSADNVADLETEFHAAVDGYLADCEEMGLEAEKPFKGSFNVRVGSENHRKAAHLGRKLGVTLNDLVRISLEHYFVLCDGSAKITIAQQAIQAPTTGYMYYQPSADAARLEVTPGYPAGRRH
jgi:predicted HicB family RNase H-like nuclease